MAISSKCPKCDNSGFELSTESPSKANYKVTFVRCSSCGAVVGTLESQSTVNLLHKLAKKLNVSLE